MSEDTAGMDIDAKPATEAATELMRLLNDMDIEDTDQRILACLIAAWGQTNGTRDHSMDNLARLAEGIIMASRRTAGHGESDDWTWLRDRLTDDTED